MAVFDDAEGKLIAAKMRSASRGCAVLHRQPHAADGEAARGRRRRLGARSLRPRRASRQHFKAVGEPMLKALAKTPPYAIFSDSLEVYNSDWTRTSSHEFRKRRGYDLHAVPARAGRRHRPEDRRHPPRLGPDAQRTLRGQLSRSRSPRGPRSTARKFRSQTYGIPPVTLSSQRARRSARRRRHAVAALLHARVGGARRAISTAGR